MTIPVSELGFTEVRGFDVLASDPSSGRSIRRLRSSARARRFRLVWKRLSHSEATTLRADYDAAKGAAGTFTFTPPGEGSGTYRFVPGQRLQITRRNAAVLSAEVEIEAEYP